MDVGRLAAIQGRLNRATPGPWGWWDVGDSSAGWDGPDMDEHCHGGMPSRWWGMSHEDHALGGSPQVLEFREGNPLPTPEDAAFLAHAWGDISWLLSEVVRLG